MNEYETINQQRCAARRDRQTDGQTDSKPKESVLCYHQARLCPMMLSFAVRRNGWCFNI